jgi:hypothetical protein
VREVIPLCVAKGYIWLAIVIDDPDLMGGADPSAGTAPASR